MAVNLNYMSTSLFKLLYFMKDGIVRYLGKDKESIIYKIIWKLEVILCSEIQYIKMCSP